MAYPGSDVTSRLQMPSSSTRPDPDAAWCRSSAAICLPRPSVAWPVLSGPTLPAPPPPARLPTTPCPDSGTLWRDARVTTPPKGSPGQPASASQGRRRERLSFPYRTGEPLRDELARAGLAPSGGSSAGADTVTPSHVLEAVGTPITGSLRFWVHPGTGAADVERLRAVLPGIVERLRTDADAGACLLYTSPSPRD